MLLPATARTMGAELKLAFISVSSPSSSLNVSFLVKTEIQCHTVGSHNVAVGHL